MRFVEKLVVNLAPMLILLLAHSAGDRITKHMRGRYDQRGQLVAVVREKMFFSSYN